MKDNDFNKKLPAAFGLNMISIYIYNYHIYLCDSCFAEITLKEISAKQVKK